MKLFALFLALVCSARAVTIINGGTLPPGYTTTETVTAANGLLLSGPGNYRAASWTLTNAPELGAPGDYTLFASSGSIVIANGIALKAGVRGTARVFLIASGSVTVVNAGSSGVTVIPQPNSPQSAFIDPAINVDLPTVKVGVAAAAPLMNISARAVLAAGQVLTPGFVIGGTEPRRVLIRAVGPGLAALGVPGTMENPSLSVFSGQTQIAANDDWDSKLAPIFSGVGAFTLASRDAALLLTLAPGSYTAQVRGDGAGDVLLEIYFVD